MCVCVCVWLNNFWNYTVPVIDEWMSVGHWYNDTERGGWSTQRETCSSAIWPTTNPTWTVLYRNCTLEVLCQAGDRIDGIRISFRNMVFEDALTILSYASPYDVQLEVENSSNSCPNTLVRTKKTSGSGIAPADRICHPFYRSQSIADLAQVGTANGNNELQFM